MIALVVTKAIPIGAIWDFKVMLGHYSNSVVQLPFPLVELKLVNFLLIIGFIIISFTFFIFVPLYELSVLAIKVLPFKI